MLERITPVILTFNEASNIERTLAALSWASDIVVVDSSSTDETPAILRATPRVRVFERPFRSHADQWNFALGQTGIATDWVLALDADYVLSEELLVELRSLQPGDEVGFETGFDYCVFGQPLHGTLYPPVVTLFLKSRGRFEQDGHTQRVRVDGPIGRVRGRIRHDDRKPLVAWLQAQDRYMRLEADKLLAADNSQLSVADRIRKLALPAPFLVFFYCMVVKRCALDGRRGMYYALQRLLAEALLALRLIERRIART